VQGKILGRRENSIERAQFLEGFLSTARLRGESRGAKPRGKGGKRNHTYQGRLEKGSRRLQGARLGGSMEKVYFGIITCDPFSGLGSFPEKGLKLTKEISSRGKGPLHFNLSSAWDGIPKSNEKGIKRWGK